MALYQIEKVYRDFFGLLLQFCKQVVKVVYMCERKSSLRYCCFCGVHGIWHVLGWGHVNEQEEIGVLSSV